MKSDKYSLNIGMKIEIGVSKTNGEMFYPSQLLDNKNGKEFMISGPIVKNDLVLLHVGEKITISYMIKDRGKHYFLAEIISRSHSQIYTLKIKRLSNIKNIQQRKYYRLSTNIPVLKCSKEKKIGMQDYTEENCETKDISGGGMKIYSNKLHMVGDKVDCSIDLLGENIFLKCKVIRIDDVDSFNYKYLIGLEFIDIDNKHRDMIIGYIFEEQRKLRLKGLI